MAVFFESELVRRLREGGLFARVINLSETQWQPGAEKARVQAEMTFVDVQTGQPVMVTAEPRWASLAAIARTT